MDEAEWLGTVWEPGGRSSNEKQLDVFELCSRKERDRMVSRDLLRTEVRIIHATWSNLFWKLLFQLRSQMSLSSSASKYLVFVTSHSDLPISLTLFLFTSLLYLVHQHWEIQQWRDSNILYKWLKLWRSHVSSKIPTNNVIPWTWREWVHDCIHWSQQNSKSPVYEQVIFQKGVQKSQFLHKSSKVG